MLAFKLCFKVTFTTFNFKRKIEPYLFSVIKLYTCIHVYMYTYVRIHAYIVATTFIL